MAHVIRYAEIGSVSSGTMRSQDLLDSFASELDYQLGRQSSRYPRKEHRALIREARRCLRHMENGTAKQAEQAEDEASDIVNELMDALDEFAPPYMHFGAHDGDGADYGFWLSDDSLEHSFDGLRVDDTSEVPRDYRGEVLHVNDHGNPTLYVSHGRGKLTEIWALV
jgi:hypothetical protein